MIGDRKSTPLRSRLALRSHARDRGHKGLQTLDRELPVRPRRALDPRQQLTHKPPAMMIWLAAHLRSVVHFTRTPIRPPHGDIRACAFPFRRGLHDDGRPASESNQNEPRFHPRSRRRPKPDRRTVRELKRLVRDRPLPPGRSPHSWRLRSDGSPPLQRPAARAPRCDHRTRTSSRSQREAYH